MRGHARSINETGMMISGGCLDAGFSSKILIGKEKYILLGIFYFWLLFYHF